jgi:hypothetical protein
MPAAVISVVEQIETATGVNILDVLVRDTSTETAPVASLQSLELPEGALDGAGVDSGE